MAIDLVDNLIELVSYLDVIANLKLQMVTHELSR
jgi:hypothetical protein